MKRICLIIAVVLLCRLPGLAGPEDATQYNSAGVHNPVIPGYFADPTVRKFGDTFYIYATTDGTGGGHGPSQVWTSKDFVNWTLHPMNWPTTPYIWAPEVVRGDDGRYYLYYSQPCQIYGGVAETPLGPWTSMNPSPDRNKDGLIIPNQYIPPVITLDWQIFRDDDGRRYGMFCTWAIYEGHGCGMVEVGKDMLPIDETKGMIPNTQLPEVFEAPFMIKRDGVYYLMYSSGSCHTDTYRVQYATAKDIWGPYSYDEDRNPILSTSEDGTIHGPGHHSVLQQDDNYYIVYHRHDNPHSNHGMHRQVCVDIMEFAPDGSIKKIHPTHEGVGLLEANTNPFENLAYCKPVKASSYYNEDFRPAYAVDDNNGTFWKPAVNNGRHWLEVDLGRVQSVQRTWTQFQYPTDYYQYIIEFSRDGTNWQVFSDRRDSTLAGCPMVDVNDVRARYMRITITGTEKPGAYAAIWNWKIFSGSNQPAEVETANMYAKPRLPAARAKGLLVDLDAADLQTGTPLKTWKNNGALGGEFVSGNTAPHVGMIAGRQCVTFKGKDFLKGTVRAPRTLAGNSSFAVSVWVYNPEVADEECLVNWAHRGGPDGTSAQLNYGMQPNWGAMAHWGWADMSYAGKVPAAGQWHHIAAVFDGTMEKVYVDGELAVQEQKMLYMHEGDPIYIGVADGSHGFLTGSIASVKLWDIALPEKKIIALSQEKPHSDLLVSLDAAGMDYGKVKECPNNAILEGRLTAEKECPEIRDIAGRIGMTFPPGASLQSDFVLTDIAQKGLTVCAVICNIGSDSETPLISFSDGNQTESLLPGQLLSESADDDTWRHIVIIRKGDRIECFVDGNAKGDKNLPVALQRGKLVIGSSADAKKTMALSSVQIFGKALSPEQTQQLYQAWAMDCEPPAGAAGFAEGPKAMNTVSVSMTAQPGSDPSGMVEYYFDEVSGNPGGTDSGWTDKTFYIDHGLKADTVYAYTIKMRDARGNVTRPAIARPVSTDSARLDEYLDRFDQDRDFLKDGMTGTIWDGLIGKGKNETADKVSCQKGVLTLESTGSWWDGKLPRGPFLYKTVTGDFVVEVEITDYKGLREKRGYMNNDCGLMVRVPKPADAGEGEDLIQLGFFPIYNQGNMATSLDGRQRPQVSNRTAWDAHRFLQIEREGSTFHLRTSPYGRSWYEMPRSPLRRKDMADLPVQVGLYHAVYSRISGYGRFDNFRLSLPR